MPPDSSLIHSVEYVKLPLNKVVGSIHMYLFSHHAAQIYSTWMTWCMNFENLWGESFRTAIIMQAKRLIFKLNTREAVNLKIYTARP